MSVHLSLRHRSFAYLNRRVSSSPFSTTTTSKIPTLYEPTAAPTTTQNDTVLTTTLQLLSWGRGASGQLGGGIEEIRLYPTPVAKLVVPTSSFTLSPTQGRIQAPNCSNQKNNADSGVVEVGISCGLFHSSLLVDGKLWIWGKGDGGQLGFGHENSLFLPTLNPNLDSVRFVALGGLHSVALTATGEVYTCTTVFGVSTESMQLSYDSRGNSVPTILLLMQGRLYAEGGLQAEGIFRINAENSQEEHVRDQLNRGDVPEGIDIHCLAGLIKAWFRELPAGVLDSLSPEQVMQCQSEDDCSQLVRLLPQTEVSLLDWAINLMADVVQQEHLNKMNARNIAMIFAPNMTQMADPLTALMYAVQVMNFLITLILKTLRERKDSVVEPPLCYVEPSDEDGHQSPSQSLKEGIGKLNEGKEQSVFMEEPRSGSSSNSNQVSDLTNREASSLVSLVKKLNPDNSGCCDDAVQDDSLVNEMEAGRVNNMTSEVQAHDFSKSAPGQSSDSNIKMVPKRPSEQQSVIRGTGPIQKARGISTLSRIDSTMERIEAWR